MHLAFVLAPWRELACHLHGTSYVDGQLALTTILPSPIYPALVIYPALATALAQVGSNPIFGELGILHVDAHCLNASDHAQCDRRAQAAREESHERHREEERGEDGEEEGGGDAPSIKKRRRLRAAVARLDCLVDQEAASNAQQ